MPQVCKCCASERAGEIAKALAQGHSHSEVSIRFDVTKSAVQRHAKNCLRQNRLQPGTANTSTPARRSRTPRIASSDGTPTSTAHDSAITLDANDPASLIALAAKLVSQALDVLDHAKGRADSRTQLAALREVRDSLQLVARLSGQLSGESVSVLIDARRQTLEAKLAELTVDDLRRLARGDVDAGNEPEERSISPVDANVVIDPTTAQLLGV